MDTSHRSLHGRIHGTSYRPIPLKWPFLVAQMALLAAAIVVVFLMQNAMPDTDNTAIIDGQPTPRFGVMKRSGIFLNMTTPVAVAATRTFSLTAIIVGPSLVPPKITSFIVITIPKGGLEGYK